MCHGGTIQGGWPYSALVNAKATRDTCDASLVIVTPGNLSRSYLMNKLTGTGMCPGTNPMPSLGQSLPRNDLQVIADWICQGAQDN